MPDDDADTPEEQSVDPFDLVDFHAHAVQTPSDASVAAMRDLLVVTLEVEGADPHVDEWGNTIATKGSGSPHVVLNTHLDTVPPHLPYERDGDRVYGRGANDAKGPLAALIAAFLAIDPDAGQVTLAVTPDEETDSIGAHHLDVADADAIIVGEPTDLAATTSARGRFQGEVCLHGVGAHAANPEAGVNALAALEPVLAALRTFDDEHGPDAHPALGPPTLTPTVVHGGGAANRIPDEVTVTFDRRSVPPERQRAFFEALQAHLDAAAPAGVGVDVVPADRETPFLEAWETDDDSAVVRALVDAGAGDPRPFGAATEASYFADDAPTVVFGPGVISDDEGAVAHSQREYVDLPDVERAAEILTGALEALVD
jgi:acetylornithine deacetylase